MLFQTNYLALVMAANPYKVLLWDDSLAQPPHELWSRFEVLNVVLRRDIVCVVSEYKIYVYEFGGHFQVLLHLETAANPKGLCVVSVAHPREWTLVCPGSTKGHLRIQVGLDDSISSSVPAHSNSVAAIAVNQAGTLAASASEQGTVIKVFACTDGQPLYEFRRGTSATQISSLVFRPDSKFIVAGSASQTVHVFKLDTPNRSSASAIASQVMGRVAEWAGAPPQEPPAILLGGCTPPTIPSSTSSSTSVSRSASLIPKYFQSARSFAQFRIPDAGGGEMTVGGSPISGPICCFAKHAGNRIIIVHPNGLLYEVQFEEGRTDPGQDCVLVGAQAYFQARPDWKPAVAGQAEVTHRDDDEDVWHVI